MKKILIANRGEIACRIIDSCKKLNLHTIAVYSDVDKNSKHVRKADESIHIGGSKAQESYLSAIKIIEAAKNLKLMLSIQVMDLWQKMQILLKKSSTQELSG